MTHADIAIGRLCRSERRGRAGDFRFRSEILSR